MLNNFQNNFIITVSFLIIFLLSMFVWIKKNFTEATNTIANNITNSSIIDDKTLLNKDDEFGTIAKNYNKLLLSLNTDMKMIIIYCVT